jgi:hypothetical protein
MGRQWNVIWWVICNSSTSYKEKLGCFKESGGGGGENANYTAINTF